MNSRKTKAILCSAFLLFHLVVDGADVLSTWDGSTNDWISPEHWSHSVASVLGFPSNGVQTYDVVIPSGAVTITQPIVVDTLNSHGSLAISSGELRLRTPFYSASGFFSGSVAVGSGAGLVLNGGWYASSNAVIGGAGLISIAGDGSAYGELGVSGGFLLFSSASVELGTGGRLGSRNSGGPGANTGGILIDANSVVSMVGSNDVYGWSGDFPTLGGPWTTNLGMVVVKTIGGVSLGPVNYGEIEFQSGCRVAGAIANFGRIAKTTAGATKLGVFPTVPFSLLNLGTLETVVGTLSLSAKGTNFGSIIAGLGATNELDSANDIDYFVLGAGTRFLGAGQHKVSRVRTAGIITNASQLRIVYAIGSGTLMNAGDGTLELGRFDGGTIKNEGVAIASGSTHVSSLWNSGSLECRDGTLDGMIHNEGMMTKFSVDPYIVGSATIISNRGAIQIDNGSIVFNNAFTNAGAIQVGSNALAFFTSNFVLATGTELDGEGAIVVTNGGTLLALTSVTNSLAVRIDGGLLVAASNYVISGSLVVSNGSISGAGEVIVASNATASLLTASVTGAGGMWRVETGARTEIASDTWLPPTVISRPIDNCGNLEIVRNVRTEAVITNRGLLRVSGRPGWESWLAKGPVLNEGDSVVSNDAQVTLTSCTNHGLIEVRGILGMGDWWISIPGLLVQDSGELKLNHGTVAANVEIRGGVITGDGTNNGIVTVSGAVAPGAPFGTLRFQELRLMPGATVQLDLGGLSLERNSIASSAAHIFARWKT